MVNDILVFSRSFSLLLVNQSDITPMLSYVHPLRLNSPRLQPFARRLDKGCFDGDYLDSTGSPLSSETR